MIFTGTLTGDITIYPKKKIEMNLDADLDHLVIIDPVAFATKYYDV